MVTTQRRLSRPTMISALPDARREDDVFYYIHFILTFGISFCLNFRFYVSLQPSFAIASFGSCVTVGNDPGIFDFAALLITKPSLTDNSLSSPFADPTLPPQRFAVHPVRAAATRNAVRRAIPRPTAFRVYFCVTVFLQSPFRSTELSLVLSSQENEHKVNGKPLLNSLAFS